MHTLKSYICYRFNTVSKVFIMSFFCIALLGIRLKLSQSYFLLFLVWNLFLAAIPFAITFYIRSKEKVSLLMSVLCSILWLLFLPNAPYIVTDIIHLTHLKATYIIYDTILILSYAIAGLYFYLQSLYDMEHIWTVHVSARGRKTALIFIPLLSGFGIYLGRFLRFNSWDIIQEPLLLFRNMVSSLQDPLAIGTTFSFGIGLWMLYWLHKKRGC